MAEKTKKNKIPTYRQVHEFTRLCPVWMKSKYPTTKFEYAVHRVHPRLSAVQAKYNELRMDILERFAETDVDGIFIKQGDQYAYTAEKSKAKNEALKNLLDSPCDLEPHFASAIPKEGLYGAEIDIYEGIVISTEMADALRNQVKESELPE